jgi:hypothetical protein
MRFFDRDNLQFEWTVGALAILLLLYVWTYVLVRSINTFACEYDGCSTEIMVLQKDSIVEIYRPLTFYDELITKAEIDFR